MVPDLAGFTSSKNYLVIFQNPAESRGTGGIVGAFAIAHVDKGSVSFTKIGSNSVLTSQQSLPITMPADFTNIYGEDPAIWQNANESPDLPSGAAIMLSLWQKQFNQQLDGVITLDPFILKQILSVTGAVQVDGHVIDASNVVAETLSNAYIEFSSDNLKRKRYLVQIIDAVANKLKSPKVSKPKLIKALVPAIKQNRILFYSASPTVETVLLTSPLSGSLSLSTGNEYRLVLINTAGNKMDFYIHRDFKVERTNCKTNEVRVTATLTNSATSLLNLPPYVMGRLDINMPNGKANSTSVAAFLYGPTGAHAAISSINDPQGAVFSEKNRPLVSSQLEIGAGKSVTISALFSGGKGNLTIYDQPLVLPETDHIIDKCAV